MVRWNPSKRYRRGGFWTEYCYECHAIYERDKYQRWKRKLAHRQRALRSRWKRLLDNFNWEAHLARYPT